MQTPQHWAERRKAIFLGSCPLAATVLQALGRSGEEQHTLTRGSWPVSAGLLALVSHLCEILWKVRAWVKIPRCPRWTIRLMYRTLFFWFNNPDSNLPWWLRFLKDCLFCDSEVHTKKWISHHCHLPNPGRRTKSFSTLARLSPTSALFAKNQTTATKLARTKRMMKELEKQIRNVQTFLQPDCFQDKVCPVNCKLPTGQAPGTNQGVRALAITEMLNAAKCRNRKKPKEAKWVWKSLKKKKKKYEKSYVYFGEN